MPNFTRDAARNDGSAKAFQFGDTSLGRSLSSGPALTR